VITLFKLSELCLESVTTVCLKNCVTEPRRAFQICISLWSGSLLMDELKLFTQVHTPNEKYEVPSKLNIGECEKNSNSLVKNGHCGF